MTLVWLVLGFAAFMLLIGSVHLINRYAVERWGYEPFSAPNTALMLIPSGLLLSLPSRQAGPDTLAAGIDAATMVSVGIWGLFLAAMFLLIARRTNVWVALYAAPLLAVAAPLVFFALLYRWLVTPGAPAD